jgi:shikimate dehydrogenase
MTPDLLSWAQGFDGTTRVVGVIGWPVRHSLSPPMQNAALAALGLNWVYVPFAVAPEHVPAALAAVRALDLVGLNVTIPHKTAVVREMDDLDDAARDLDAVNTVVHRGGRLTGYNTDGEGFLRSLREMGEEVAGRPVCLIGAGGSARAVALAVCRAGAASLTVVNRTLAKALALVEALGGLVPGADLQAVALEAPQAGAVVAAAELVIDSTAVGMYPQHEVPPVVPEAWLRAGQVVCDLTYNPRDTVLLQAARRRQARTLDGTGMLVHQGALALELWTGQCPPVAEMRAALLRALAERRPTP